MVGVVGFLDTVSVTLVAACAGAYGVDVVLAI